MKRIVLCVVLLVLFGMVTMNAVPSSVSPVLSAHVQTTYEVGNYTCWLPSAKNSSYVLGAGSLTPPADGYRIWHDGLTYPDLFATSFPRTAQACTNDFTSSTWYGYPTPFQSNISAPAGAVITSVQLVAIFVFYDWGYPASFVSPTGWQMAYSKTSTPSFINAAAPIIKNLGGYALYTGGNPPYYNVAQYGYSLNVTTLENWTTLLTSRDLSVKLSFTVPAMMTFYLDYLGLLYTYYVPPGIGSAPGTDYPNEPWAPSPYTPANLSTVIGFGGLLGLVATVPIGVWAMRGTGERGKTFLGILLFGAASFGLMMSGFSLG